MPDALVVGGTLPQTRFDVCWLETLSGGGKWTNMLGCSLIVYCWAFSERKFLWNLLLVHAFGGLAGTLVEGAWVAAANCGLTTPGDPSSNLRYILLVNELDWIPHESAVIAYSYLKTKGILQNPTAQKALNCFLALIFLLYVACRINIGRLRFANNIQSNDDIALAHTQVYTLWFAADVVLFALLTWNLVVALAFAPPNAILRTLLNSSLPRFAVIVANNLLLSVLNFAQRAPGLDPQAAATLKNAAKFTSLVKGTYPVILLIDVLMTKYMLFGEDPVESSMSAGSGKGGAALAAAKGGGGGSINALNAALGQRGGGSTIGLAVAGRVC
ncbi:hypothetical protein DFJ73DRAFT_786030 [Zopfochytrium polystomum]|nr:hypothetical protein DFJ73DRAFT_786030 [Zopfochytrium polystomum]